MVPGINVLTLLMGEKDTAALLLTFRSILFHWIWFLLISTLPYCGEDSAPCGLFSLPSGVTYWLSPECSDFQCLLLGCIPEGVCLVRTLEYVTGMLIFSGVGRWTLQTGLPYSNGLCFPGKCAHGEQGENTLFYFLLLCERTNCPWNQIKVKYILKYCGPTKISKMRKKSKASK